MKEEQMKGAEAPDQKGNNSEEVLESKSSTEESEDAPATVEGDESSEVERLAQELKEAKDKHLRLYSEFENYRRRTAKERLELIGSANADLINALLPILDDFERAREASENADSITDHEGMALIYQKLIKELKNKGLKPMEDLVGQHFDAEIHEAISQVPAPQKKLQNRIVAVVEKGYYLNDKVLRYAKVVIGT
jgi:molecular chaperone GrpE